MCGPGTRLDQPKDVRSIFPQATRDAADLLKKLLVFDPEKRLTAAEALRHPYVANFHDPANEPRCSRPVTIPINDNEKVLACTTTLVNAQSFHIHRICCAASHVGASCVVYAYAPVRFVLQGTHMTACQFPQGFHRWWN